MPGEPQVVAVHHHEVTLPNNQLVPEAETKEEEIIRKKKTEVVTKRQIATRVQRNVLLKDGKVVVDSGPKVTTTTTEDTTKEETENTEHHDIPTGTLTDWKPNGDPNVFQEVREKKVTTRNETNETIETEDVKHLGDISDEAYQKAIEAGRGEEVEKLLAVAPGTEVSRRGPVVVSHHTTSRKTTDTEDTVKTSALDSSGNVVTNTSTVRDHEVVKELDAPDEGGSLEEFDVEKKNEYRKTRSQGFVEEVTDTGEVKREMRYDAETTEGKRHGDADWESLSARLRRNRNRFLKEMEEERKDALTKRPLDFTQEERIRKMETSKWLEHHFGSESATSRSSRSSEDEAGPHTSFINVTMKSTKDPKPSKVFLSSPDSTEKSYFKGVSEWKSEERKVRSPVIDGVQVLPTGPNHTFNSSPSPPYTKSPSPSYHNRSKSPSPQFVGTKLPSTQNIERINGFNGTTPHGEGRYTKTTNYYRHERTTSPLGRSSPQYSYSNGRQSPSNGRLSAGRLSPTREYSHTPTSVSPPPRRRGRRREERREEEPAIEEPAPDYSPTPEPRSRHSPSPHSDTKKKVYQRTRFAADIPPPPMKHHTTSQTSTKNGKEGGKAHGGLGESFRRLVGRLRGGSGGGRHHGSHHSVTTESGTQTGDIESELSRHRSQTPERNGGRREKNGMTTVHRYYLGEDPFQGSIYGKESEYPRTKKSELRHESNSTSTLGRLSKSTSRLGGDRAPVANGSLYHHYSPDRGGVQTLPRKLREEHKTKKQVYVTRSNGEPGSNSDRHRLGHNSSSMFNVSMSNGLSGPTKPARTYRSNLLRSKSFNVHGGDMDRSSSRYTSNPALSRLDEESPLKSPGIISSISRSTRDLTFGDEERRHFPTLETRRNGYTNNFRGTSDTKKKIFMKGLMERSPELYKTLHGPEPLRSSTPLRNGKLEYSTSFRSSDTSSPSFSNYRSSPDVNRSIVRRGSNDFTETVSYTTKSDDPIRPSVTNSVQTFTKKTVPRSDGRRETIQSTETKTVRKSHFRSGTPEALVGFDSTNKYSPNGGVIIEVRNTRK